MNMKWIMWARVWSWFLGIFWISATILVEVNFLILFQETVLSTWNRWFLPKIISPVSIHGLVGSVARPMWVNPRCRITSGVLISELSHPFHVFIVTEPSSPEIAEVDIVLNITNWRWGKFEWNVSQIIVINDNFGPWNKINQSSNWIKDVL